jgi:benzoate membrane transport protein
MEALPMPIVMGMVAGVFLRFGLDLVRALHQDVGIAGADGDGLPAAVGLPAWGAGFRR